MLDYICVSVEMIKTVFAIIHKVRMHIKYAA